MLASATCLFRPVWYWDAVVIVNIPNKNNYAVLLTKKYEDNFILYYSRYPLSRALVFSNFFFGPFSTFGNCPYELVRYLEPRNLELSYVEVFSRSLQRFLGLFSICYLERFHFIYSNVAWTHSKTLIECLVFLISTQHVGQEKA